MSRPSTRKFMHRLPMLLRLLLNPLSYFHPVRIASITTGGSGKWIQHLLQTHVFEHYGEHSADIRRLETRVNAWLAGANFVLQLDRVTGGGQVPFFTNFDIEARLSIADVIVYRALPQEISLTQAVRLRGADASVTIPTFLLPHHEHLLPPLPTKEDEDQKEKEIGELDGTPQMVQAEAELEQTRKDETIINISARARLPAILDQQLLDFIAALVKATKFIEIEKSLEEKNLVDKPNDDAETSSIASVDTTQSEEEEVLPAATSAQRWSDFKVSMKTFNKKMNTGMEKTWRRGIVGGMANDRWIAKLVGKVTRLLETIRGDVGYSGDIPIPLGPYRERAETATKLLA